MNRNLAFAIVISTAAAAGTAFADDIGMDNTPFHSTASRAEVRAELVRFQQSASDPWADYQPVAAFHSSVTRAEVRAQYIAARGEVAAMNGEDSGSVALAHGEHAPAGTRIAGQPGNAE